MANESVAFDRAADYYDNTRGFPSGVEQEVAALMARIGRLSKSSCVLEIGVGTGRIALPVAEHVGAYVGIDLARPMMDRLIAKRRDEAVYLVQGDATRLPFPDHAFDAVIAVHVFHLIPGWREALQEVARVLRPGAPLLHGGNARLLADALQEVWRIATDEQHEAEGAISHDRRSTFLVDNGWREAGAVQTYQFHVQRSPQDFVNNMEGRCFSSTWRMTDEQIARGLVAVREYIATHYDDPTKPEALEASFTVQSYLPPES